MNHKRLYIGDLPAGITEQSLRELLATIGEIESISLTPGKTQQLHSFALVEMVSSDAAREAVQRFNGYEMNGSRLIVYTVPPKSRPRSPSH